MKSIDVFNDNAEILRTAVSDTTIITTRARCVCYGEGATIHAPTQESFSLAYLLTDLPRHEFWSDEGRQKLPDLARGSFHFMDLRHGGNARFRSTFDTLNVLIPIKTLSVLAEQIGSEPPTALREPVPWASSDPVIESFEQAIVHALSGGADVDPLVGDHLNLALVSHVAIRFGGMRKPAASMLGSLARWQLRRAKEILASSLASRVSLVEVARRCGVSASHFSRAFKASTGLSPSVWMLKLRIARARDLLQNTGMSLAEVASQCGFADQAHFTRAFARDVGTTPGLWRRCYRRT